MKLHPKLAGGGDMKDTSNASTIISHSEGKLLLVSPLTDIAVELGFNHVVLHGAVQF